jgi:hypothetical protein
MRLRGAASSVDANLVFSYGAIIVTLLSFVGSFYVAHVYRVSQLRLSSLISRLFANEFF